MYRFQTRQESQIQKSQESAQRLWLFSLEMWRHDPVQNGLLTLQDEFGANINALLFAAWLAWEDRSFDPNSVAQGGLSDWNVTMTVPLRALRRHAKAESAELYQCLKGAELAAERHEQKLLAATFDELALASENTSRESLLHANLVSYLHTLCLQTPGAQDIRAALHHCEALQQHALVYTSSATREPDSP